MFTQAISSHAKRRINADLFTSFAKWFASDSRHYQVTFLTIFLFYGVTILQWDINPLITLLAFISCLCTQYLFIRFKTHDYRSVKSALISSLSLCLLLKTNDPVVMLL